MPAPPIYKRPGIRPDGTAGICCCPIKTTTCCGLDDIQVELGIGELAISCGGTVRTAEIVQGSVGECVSQCDQIPADDSCGCFIQGEFLPICSASAEYNLEHALYCPQGSFSPCDTRLCQTATPQFEGDIQNVEFSPTHVDHVNGLYWFEDLSYQHLGCSCQIEWIRINLADGGSAPGPPPAGTECDGGGGTSPPTCGVCQYQKNAGGDAWDPITNNCSGGCGCDPTLLPPPAEWPENVILIPCTTP